jgi:hypothetical protein
MNFDEIIQSYVNLLIIQYNNKPKARAMINLIVSLVYGQGNFLSDNWIYNVILQSIDYRTAIGDQLTRIAKEENINRYIDGVYISDDDLRLLLDFRIIANNINCTLYNIDTLLYQFFGTDIFIQWNQNMTAFIYANYPNDLLELAIQQNLLPLPTNIQVTLFINTFDIVFVDSTELNSMIYAYDNVSARTLDLVITI